MIEVVDRTGDSAPAPAVTSYGVSVHDESLDIAEDEEDDTIVVEGEEEPETMEITPQE